MLTPDKIKEKQFQSSGRGSYRADDVDLFMNEVSASYEQMFKENGDLVRKISILAKKVEEYRADEESLKMALLNAQKLADQIVSEAKEKAEAESSEAVAAAEKKVADAQAQAQELSSNSKRESAAIIDSAKAEAERIIADANKQSDEILGNINRKVTHETLVFDMTKKEASEFKAKLVAMYKEHINLINQLPEIADEAIDKAQENAAEETAEETADEATAEIANSGTFEPVAAEEAEHAETEEISAVEEPAAEAEPEEPSEPVFEDVYSDSTDEAPSEKETSNGGQFRFDLSKIDFSDDEDEEPKESVAPVFEKIDDEPEIDNDPDEGSGSVSFKNFFKKK